MPWYPAPETDDEREERLRPETPTKPASPAVEVAECSRCVGTGTVEAFDKHYQTFKDCPACNGTGTPHPAVAVPGSLSAIKEAFEEGFYASNTYNDVLLNDSDEAWEKSNAKAALATTSTAAQPAECSDCKRREVYKTWPHRRPGCTQCAES